MCAETQEGNQMFSTLETKVVQLLFNPQIEDVTIENGIAPENIEHLEIKFRFLIQPGKISCQVYQD